MEGRWGGWVKAGYCVQGLFKVGIFGSHLPFQTSGALEAVSASDRPRLETTHGMEGGKGIFLHNVWFSTLQHGSQTMVPWFTDHFVGIG